MCNEQNTPLSVSKEELNDKLLGSLAMFDIIVCSAECVCKICRIGKSCYQCPVGMIKAAARGGRVDLQEFMEKAGGEE